MGLFRYAEGKLITGTVIGLEVANKADAKRLVSHFISKRIDFACREVEGYFELYVEELTDFERLRKAFPAAKWEIMR